MENIFILGFTSYNKKDIFMSLLLQLNDLILMNFEFKFESLNVSSYMCLLEYVLDINPTQYKQLYKYICTLDLIICIWISPQMTN